MVEKTRSKELRFGGLETGFFGAMLGGNSGGPVAETEPKKIGRPKAGQTLPLILAQSRPKVIREFTMEAHTAQMIDDYAGWAADTGGISREEAKALLIGRSIDAFVRKDHLFTQFLQDHKGRKTNDL
jgi:hypothetical protein